MTKTKRFICICSGNICRSPMAVALLRRRLEDRSIAHLVISAGTLGIQGRRAARFARQAIAEVDEQLGRIVEGHRSQGISPSMLDVADYLIVMSPRHEQYVLRVRPDAASRLVRLWKYAPEDMNLRKIPDPVGHDADVFRHSRNLIDQCLKNWLHDLYGPRADSSTE